MMSQSAGIFVQLATTPSRLSQAGHTFDGSLHGMRYAYATPHVHPEKN